MILQIDIIPSRAGYAGAALKIPWRLRMRRYARSWRRRIRLWQRIVTRRAISGEQLGIVLPEEVLPFSNTVGYLRPWLISSGPWLLRLIASGAVCASIH
jgi:hypothetical protein